MIDLFLIDDHPPVITGLEFMFSWSEAGIQIIGSATTIKEALTKLSVSSPHVILLDLFMGDEDPLVNLSLIRAMHRDIPVIIYSVELSTWWKKRMFSEGISAYLCKCADEEKIISTILQVAKGDIVLPPDVQEIITANSKQDIPESITSLELELGRDLAFGLTIKEIAAKQMKSPSAVEKACRELRKKTGAHTQAELIRILIGRKLIPVYTC
ncbi:MAG: response regulator transcription factor [Bacteroidota bacterium]